MNSLSSTNPIYYNRVPIGDLHLQHHSPTRNPSSLSTWISTNGHPQTRTRSVTQIIDLRPLTVLETIGKKELDVRERQRRLLHRNYREEVEIGGGWQRVYQPQTPPNEPFLAADSGVLVDYQYHLCKKSDAALQPDHYLTAVVSIVVVSRKKT
ncbi:hypothetical protein L2E82_48146 [Cichorium intybus]|uniref:Uncharacterized protein n=1 Tax=Cichorium intybus TaxID=13427 RepID=A0ACB8YXK9_CICIN|nr:hypothetical protein L2E82_48146 [Cichorium intybus]